MHAYPTVKGMPVILPPAADFRLFLEQQLAKIMQQYGYQRILLPVIEYTNLFKHSVGEVTDIVEKEMYSFLDNNGESLTLRPEGTAGCVRACIEHGMLRNQQQHRLWYYGPMFRYEAPQKGRYRQFFQWGVEQFNCASPEAEVEHLLMVYRLLQNLGIADKVNLQINSLGCKESRDNYRDSIKNYFAKHLDSIDEDCKRRLHTNPLRILDSKNPKMQALIAEAPKILDYISDKSHEYFDYIVSQLQRLAIPHEVNPRIVRGLDYYNDTVYEWVSGDLGAQSALCAGGRFDGLLAQLHGPQGSAVGFALGLDRLAMLLATATLNKSIIYLICLDKAILQRVALAEKIRNKLPNWQIFNPQNQVGLKVALKKAEKHGAKLAFIVGETELAAQAVTVHYCQSGMGQRHMLALEDLTEEYFIG